MKFTMKDQTTKQPPPELDGHPVERSDDLCTFRRYFCVQDGCSHRFLRL